MKQNKQDMDLEYQKRNLKARVTQRYTQEPDSSHIFIFILLLLSLALIVGGGLGKNLYLMGSGSLILIFLYFSLR